ncbi:MAG: DNA-directed RNA polymerase subunit L [Candidatus Bathyarchaeota archaeon]|nr:DNA-directed RNA polymerase subunit L [Candidatus Bathyarchaeota archaeon]MDH5687382.1 DNA-directed RNA polymerase subunit L [Candidatus Bathyarchaeota archaeon]
MQIKVLKKTSNELRIEIEGEGHTLCNLLEKVLLEDESIDMAAYNIPHPLISNPAIYIRTKGRRSPETALKDAADKILKIEKNFRASFEKALENWEKEQKS